MKSTTSVFCISVFSAMTVFADATISENMTLSSDLDWRSDGVVTVEDGVTVDLNGYNIWVSGLAGSGTFTSSDSSTPVDIVYDFSESVFIDCYKKHSPLTLRPLPRSLRS